MELQDLLVRRCSGDLVALFAESTLELVDLLWVLDWLPADLWHERLLGNVLLPLLLLWGSLTAVRRAGNLRPWLQLRRKALQVVLFGLTFEL